MKISIIGPAYPYRGGIAAFTERLAVQLKAEGHEVTIYTFKLQYPKILFPGKSQYLEEKGPKNLKIIRCINSINPFNWMRVGNNIKKNKPDLVIPMYWLPFMAPCYGTILRRIKRNRHTKIVSIVHNMVPHESKIGDKTFSKYFVGPVDAFVALSKNVLSDIAIFNNDKPRIQSPHPLFDHFGEAISREAALKKLGLEANYRYMLFFGLIRKYKGLDILLQAFADSRFRNSNLKLIIAGEYYSDKEPYMKIINDHGLHNDIIEIDKYIPDSEVKYFFNASDVIVQPYKSATQSGVTQIAYHFNKPMIVTDVGGLAELCPNNKVGYVTPVDATKLADAIYKFFYETNQSELINNIKEEKKKYSWEILAKNVLSLIKTK